ncbi:hypothetical protein SDRG_17194 [Saprolegnia diclina VS20]|uniref:Uncharacterized protein n=1 Tax=Saprolegnia diclina (strain VS20) TaxID=1156394 RepID=T0QYU1_SAPDV|nr:hypothetical protein SDRG_17194 [Saprolegnia diclina VS20]EQC24913.1 hypothetical protein SDRG_17194 [Saprolegnia diclina VS20]|eukprot:XP_008621654.1 hypothetical protein SDRG_17194 [Saprolegnia diclina VS20]
MPTPTMAPTPAPTPAPTFAPAAWTDLGTGYFDVAAGGGQVAATRPRYNEPGKLPLGLVFATSETIPITFGAKFDCTLANGVGVYPHHFALGGDKLVVYTENDHTPSLLPSVAATANNSASAMTSSIPFLQDMRIDGTVSTDGTTVCMIATSDVTSTKHIYCSPLHGPSNWTDLGGSDAHALAVHGDTIYYATPASLFQSTLSDKTWTQVTTPGFQTIAFDGTRVCGTNSPGTILCTVGALSANLTWATMPNAATGSNIWIRVALDNGLLFAVDTAQHLQVFPME